MILMREFNQIFNFTFSAAFNIPCDLNLAVKILNAMRKEDQKFIGLDPVSVRSDEMIVQFDKRLPDSSFDMPTIFPIKIISGKRTFATMPLNF